MKDVLTEEQAKAYDKMITDRQAQVSRRMRTGKE